MGILIAGAIWDMDGVLVDSGPFHFQSWQIVLKKHGTSISMDKFKSTFGQDNRGVLTEVFGHPPQEELLQTISEEKESLYRSLVKGSAHSLPGVLEWLQRFRDHGVRQAVASSAPPANVDTLIDEMKLKPYFDQTLSALGQGLPGKPNPAIFLRAAELLRVEPAKCVVFEDSLAGIEAARRAGMACVAITSTHPRHELGQANLIVDDFNSIPLEYFQYEPATNRVENSRP